MHKNLLIEICEVWCICIVVCLYYLL